MSTEPVACGPALAFASGGPAPDLGRADPGRTDLGTTDRGRTELGRTELGRTDLGSTEIDVTRLRVALARLSRWLRRHELAGLTPTQLAALATIARTGPMRLGDLAAAEGIAPSTLTRLVTALEDSGYVRRLADPTDARASTLTITPHGQDALQRIRAETTLMLTESLEGLSPDQRSALAAALPVLERLAEAQPNGAGNNSLYGPSLQVSQAAGQLVAVPGDFGQPHFELDDAADGRQGDALAGHADHPLDDPDLMTGVAALVSR